MEVNIIEEAQIYTITISGDLDFYSARELKTTFLSMRKNRIDKLIINFQDVLYIDSTGIGILMYIYSELKKDEASVYFTHIHGTVEKVIHLTKLDKFFPIVENNDTATRLLKHGVKK